MIGKWFIKRWFSNEIRDLLSGKEECIVTRDPGLVRQLCKQLRSVTDESGVKWVFQSDYDGSFYLIYLAENNTDWERRRLEVRYSHNIRKLLSAPHNKILLTSSEMADLVYHLKFVRDEEGRPWFFIHEPAKTLVDRSYVWLESENPWEPDTTYSLSRGDIFSFKYKSDIEVGSLNLPKEATIEVSMRDLTRVVRDAISEHINQKVEEVRVSTEEEDLS